MAVNTHKCSVVSSKVFGPMWKNVCPQMLNGVHWIQSNFGHNRVGSSFTLLKDTVVTTTTTTTTVQGSVL